jgi:hypothetical protein
VGGGPAGSSAALSALMHSAAATIIEKSRLPRHKVCGEFLSPEACGILNQLQCLDRIRELGPAIIRRMTLHLNVGGGRGRWGLGEKCCALTEPALGLSRYALDHVLFETAVARGAVPVRESFSIHETGTSPADSRGNLVLAIGRKATMPGGNRLFGFKAHFAGPLDDAVELFFFDGCYVGVSSVEGGATNVCGLAPERVLRACGFRHDELLSRSRALALRVSPLSRTMPWLTVGPLVFGHSLRAPHEEGVYRAGDALAFTDPFAGSGMLNAMLTGSLAGQAAARNLPVSDYVRDCRHALERSFQISAIFRLLLKTGLAPLLAGPVPGRWLMQWTRPAGSFVPA